MGGAAYIASRIAEPGVIVHRQMARLRFGPVLEPQPRRAAFLPPARESEYRCKLSTTSSACCGKFVLL